MNTTKTKTKRCPNGTRKNKKTTLCKPYTNKTTKKPNPPKYIKAPAYISQLMEDYYHEEKDAHDVWVPENPDPDMSPSFVSGSQYYSLFYDNISEDYDNKQLTHTYRHFKNTHPVTFKAISKQFSLFYKQHTGIVPTFTKNKKHIIIAHLLAYTLSIEVQNKHTVYDYHHAISELFGWEY